MRCLVSGGCGFLGSHLVDKLVDKYEVHIIDDLSGGFERNLNPKAKLWKMDLREATKTNNIIEDIKPEIVFACAANAAENKAQFSPIDITSRNYEAFINTLTPFIKYGGKRFIFTSSIAVYGSLQTPFRESDKPEPEDLYGITKLAAEQTLHVMSKVHGFEYVIVRPHNVFGERQNMSDPYRNVVTIWMNQILRGEPITIYGDGNQIRCFSYIAPVVDAIYDCGFKDVSGMTFNIGSAMPYSLNELYALMQDVVGHDIKAQYLPERPQEVKKAIANHALSKKYLGLKRSVSMIEGLRRTWKWCQEMGPQELFYTPIEIKSDKIPSNWKK